MADRTPQIVQGNINNAALSAQSVMRTLLETGKAFRSAIADYEQFMEDHGGLVALFNDNFDPLTIQNNVNQYASEFTDLVTGFDPENILDELTEEDISSAFITDV